MAKLISGKEVSAEIQAKLRDEVNRYELKPLLAIVQVGNREDSNVYIRMKIKYAQDVGVEAKHYKLPRTINENELIEQIDTLNRDILVHGIIVQLPLDCENKIDPDKITNLICPTKDVDGLSDLNAGKLLHGQITGESCFLPCTPYGCLQLIKKSGIEIAGANAVVLGRSKIVGSPMAQLLIWHHATVTVVHSKTRNIPDIVRQADIVVVAIGRPNFVKGSWLKSGAVVIDCGISAIPDETKKSGQRLVGDVDFEECKEVASYITPVPGGVGPMTVAMLIANTVDSAKRVKLHSVENDS